MKFQICTLLFLGFLGSLIPWTAHYPSDDTKPLNTYPQTNQHIGIMSGLSKLSGYIYNLFTWPLGTIKS